jgi:uncharacterized protein (TIGR03083 family)
MSADRSPDAIADHYIRAHDRLVDLVHGIDADRAQAPVPGTPLWTVHDVLAHLASIPSEIAAGRLTGIPTPEQTQAQVEERRGRGIPALLEEWEQGLAPIVEATRAGLIPPPLAVDAITHEQDIRGALGAPTVPDAEAVDWAAHGFAPGLGMSLGGAGLAPLRLTDPAAGFDAVAGKGEPAVTVTAPVFELFRAIAGRRSRAQVAAFGWDGDSAPYLDAFCIFGPLRQQDLSDV